MLTLLASSFFVVTCVQADDVAITVQLDGAPEGKKETLLSGLSIVQQQTNKRLPIKRLKRLHQQANDELSQMLEVYGYYKSNISSQLQQIDDQWLATYQLELAEPVTIGTVSITIEGAALQDKSFQRLLANFPLQVGDVFNHERYEVAKKSLLRLAAERGYFDGELTEHKVEVNLASNQSNVFLNYQSGQRYVFAATAFPSTVVDYGLLLRLTPIKQGEPYLASKVLKLRNNLNNSGYFKACLLYTSPSPRD